MAIDFSKVNAGGITLMDNFGYYGDRPLDSRSVVPSLEGLQNLMDNGAAYAGMITYVTSEERLYEVYDNEGALAYRPLTYTQAELNDIVGQVATAAMEFKGATATLPESPAKGDMYKVVAEFKVDDETVKVGDSIVYNGEQWFVIPSGDDIEDTWRKITGVNNDADLTFVNGNNTTADVKTTGEVTFHHNKLTAAPADITKEEDLVDADGNRIRTYLTAVEVDEYGHVTNFKTGTENVEDTNTTYTFEGQVEDGASSVHFSVQASDANQAQEIYLDAYTRNDADGKFVAIDGDKVLSDNNFTDELLTKLNGIADNANKYEHAEHTAYAEGFYKVTVDAEGHVSNAVAVTKEDIVALGIPGQDTTYEQATAEADGLMSKEHFAKVEGISEGATKVEASENNGKIMIDGTEVTVYEHPTKHTIDDVTGLQDALNGKVDVVDGKGLSTNDLTDELKGQYDEAYAHSQIAHAPANAQENIIESVKVNGEALAITNKAVDITIPTGALAGKNKIEKTDLAETLATELDGKVKSVTAGDASITIGGSATEPTVAVKLSAAEGNAITLAEDGLKVIIPESTKVEASATNGNIKVDGEEVTVYTHPKHTHEDISDFDAAVAAIKVASADHADAAAKVDKALTVKVGGEDVVYDGSAEKTADIDAAIKAAVDEIPADTNTTYILSYDNTGDTPYIVLTPSEGEATKVDATAFIKDGMISNVELSEDGLNIVITWNTDSDKGENNVTTIPLGGLVDVYTAKNLTTEDTDEVKVAISNKNEISATLVDGKIAKAKLDTSVQASLDKADSALQAHQDISHLAKTDDLGELAYADSITAEKVDDFADEVAKVKVNEAKKADEAIKATQDGNGKNIAETYAVKATTLAGYNISDAYTKEETYAKTEVYTKAEVEAMLTWGEF